MSTWWSESQKEFTFFNPFHLNQADSDQFLLNSKQFKIYLLRPRNRWCWVIIVIATEPGVNSSLMRVIDEWIGNIRKRNPREEKESVEEYLYFRGVWHDKNIGRVCMGLRERLINFRCLSDFGVLFWNFVNYFLVLNKLGLVEWISNTYFYSCFMSFSYLGVMIKYSVL